MSRQEVWRIQFNSVSLNILLYKFQKYYSLHTIQLKLKTRKETEQLKSIKIEIYMLINIVLKDCIYIECAVLNIIRKQSPREFIMCVLLWILTSSLQTSKNGKNSRKISKKSIAVQFLLTWEIFFKISRNVIHV